MPNLLEEETMVVVVVKLCKNAAKPMTTVQDSVSTLVKIIPLGSFNGKKETFVFVPKPKETISTTLSQH